MREESDFAGRWLPQSALMPSASVTPGLTDEHSLYAVCVDVNTTIAVNNSPGFTHLSDSVCSLQFIWHSCIYFFFIFSKGR